MKKKVFLMLPCIAAVAIATFVGKKTFESNAYDTNSLLIQNVEALASGGDNQVSSCPNGYARFKTERPYPWSDEEEFTYCNGCVDKKGFSPTSPCKYPSFKIVCTTNCDKSC